MTKFIKIKEFLSISGLSIILIENKRPRRSFSIESYNSKSEPKCAIIVAS